MIPGPLTPMNTSVPRMISEIVPLRCSGLVHWASRCLAMFRSVRPLWMAPCRSAPMMFSTPAFLRIWAMATPAAPAPAITTDRSAIRLSTIFSAFSSAARITTAVPCWSSWKTGMSRLSRRRSSTSKQAGAAMSSRLIPPKTGAMRSTVSMISSVLFTFRQIGKASTPANSLNSRALPSMTGRDASGPMSPSPSTAVPSVTMATVLRLMVSSWTRAGSRSMARQTRATPGV